MVNEEYAVPPVEVDSQQLPYWLRVRMKLLRDKQAPLVTSIEILNAWLDENRSHPCKSMVRLASQVAIAESVIDELIAEERASK